MELKTKKKIAREVLLFFGTIALTGLFYLGIILWNGFLINSNSKLTEVIMTLEIEINKLPKDKIQILYLSGLNEELVVNYQVDKDKYVIPKKEENEFLKEFPNARQIENYPNRHSFFKVKSVNLKGKKIRFTSKFELGTKVKELYPSYSDLPNEELSDRLLKKYRAQDDSILVFDFVGLDEFRTLMQDSSYRNKFYDFASIKYDIGTREEYDGKIKEGFQYDGTAKAKSDELHWQLRKKRSKLWLNQQRKVAKTDILKNTLSFWFIVLASLYPVRIIFIALRWSLKTIRK